MESECAFCGRDGAAAQQVSCEDCQARHNVCPQCAAEAVTEEEGYRLVAA